MVRTKISWFICFLLYCSELEKDGYIENVHVLSCFVLSKSVLLISCVFWIFFQNAGSQLCFRSVFVVVVVFLFMAWLLFGATVAFSVLLYLYQWFEKLL